MNESAKSARGKIVYGIHLRNAHEIVYGVIARLSKRSSVKNAGFCWASNGYIAMMTGYTKSYVSHIITDLDRVGWVYRRIEYAPNGEVEVRALVPLDKLTPNTELAERRVREMEKECEQKGDINRLRHNGMMLGINPDEISKAVYQYGNERVDELLAIIYTSNSCKSARKFFYAGLQRVFLAGRRARRWVGKWFVRPTQGNQGKAVLGAADSIKATVAEINRPLDSTFLASLSRMGGKAAATAARMSTTPTA